jgi:TetR/AcrR family tetracycline transcriptional repressor
MAGWSIPPQTRRRRRLTREAIVAAAADLLQREGFEAVTIRNVAAALGVKSASLYWHVPTKGALEDLLADELLAGHVQRQPSGDWRADLRAGSLNLLRHLLARRDAGRVLAGRLVAGPNTLRWMEDGLGPFRAAGLSDRDAAFASHALHVYVVGFVIFQGADLSGAATEGRPRAEVLAGARDLFANLPADEFPNVRALAADLTAGDAEGRFLFGVDCFIDGLVRRAKA